MPWWKPVGDEQISADDPDMTTAELIAGLDPEPSDEEPVDEEPPEPDPNQLSML